MKAAPLFFPRPFRGLLPWARIAATLLGLATIGTDAWARNPAQEDAPPQLKRSRTEIDPSLEHGYANLQSGRLDEARHDYERAWRNDPKNPDVLLGLAAIAQRQGQTAHARHYLELALEADPKDAGVQAASLDMTGTGNSMAVESHLKNLLASQPQSAPLNFALGNLYSRQNRWPEAQQRYFNAVAADGENPDFLFNLAVSLEHLRQPRQAARHYRLALDAANRQSPAFDPEQVKKRLFDLEP